MKYNYNNNSGFTILEVLIAAMLTAILAASVFSFYVRMNAQSEAQFNIAEAQHLCRISIADIKKHLRMAGYKLPSGHPPYEINGDSLSIYYEGSQPVDSILYYLEEFTAAEYSRVPNHNRSIALYKLLKKENSSIPQIFADYILELEFDESTAGSVIINMRSQSSGENLARYDAQEGSSQQEHDQDDDDYDEQSNYETYSLEERITLRNI